MVVFPNRKPVKRRIQPYTYRRKGKIVSVKKPFRRTYYLGKKRRKSVTVKKPKTRKINPKAKQKIRFNQAKAIFEQRPIRSQKMDIRYNSKTMFAVPNKMWADAPNRFDIWGLDGYDAPAVSSLPDIGLPFQVVKYQNEIYKANARGYFTKPDIKIVKLDPMDPTNQKQFEQENPGKNAIWANKTTRVYEIWLNKNAKLEDIATKLDYTSPKNKLYETRELYNSLNLSREDQKKMMLRLYNKVYENKAKSYTKDYMEFYEHRYDDNLEGKIRSEETRLKEKLKDPAKSEKAKEQYKTSELRLYNLMAMVESKGYYDYNIKALRETMLELKNGENDEIVGDFIKTFKDEYGTDSDMLYIDEGKTTKDYTKMREYYEQKSYDEYLEYLEQEQYL